jgi:hypothetical protein
MSICRHGGAGEHRTRGAVIIELKGKRIMTHYIIGTNPCRGEYQIKSWF